MYRSVEIGKVISGEKLLEVLDKAAKPIRSKALMRDNYLTIDSLEPGDGVKEKKHYSGTDIILFTKNLHLPLACIYGIEKGENADSFGIRTGISMPFPYCLGFASRKRIRKYLSAVSEMINGI